MAVQVWVGEKPEHSNERRVIMALASALDRLDGLYLALANFSVGGRTVDLVIIKSDAIFIIELKHCDGRVFGDVNGPWFIEDVNGERKRINPGRKNPYNQVISYYYSLINFLNERRPQFLSSHKASSVDFRTCQRLVVIAPTIQAGSVINTDWKVGVLGLDQLPAYLVTERSTEIELRDDEHWRRPARIEFHVDFENSGNLNDDFTSLPLVGGATCIFQIGCHLSIDGREPAVSEIAAAVAAGAAAGERLFTPRSEDQAWFPSFGQWSGDRLNAASERAVMDAWLAYMNAWRESLNVTWAETRIVHWSPAERNLLFTAADSAASRHPTWSLPEEIGWFDAFDELVYRVPVSVRGAYGYGLKDIAKSMRAEGLIDVSWGDGPADGMGAMAAAYTADARAAAEGKRLADYDYFRAGAEYNAADCRSMFLVLAWLRANR